MSDLLTAPMRVTMILHLCNLLTKVPMSTVRVTSFLTYTNISIDKDIVISKMWMTDLLTGPMRVTMIIYLSYLLTKGMTLIVFQSFNYR